MLLEVLPRWPFVRRVKPVVRHTHGHTPHGVPHHAHRSWVHCGQGVGWIHHHEHDGFVIELKAGGLVKLKPSQFTHIAEPK